LIFPQSGEEIEYGAAMATIVKPLPAIGEPAQFPYDRLRKFSVSQYHRMIASGALAENDPVELLEGWLVSKIVPRSK